MRTLTNDAILSGQAFRWRASTMDRLTPGLDLFLPWLNRFIFVSLLALILLVAVPYGTVEPWWIALYECAAFGLATLWVSERLLRGSWSLGDGALLAPLAALTAFVQLQSVSLSASGTRATISADAFETHLLFFKLLALTLTFTLLAAYISSPKRLRLAIHAVLFVAVVSALFGIVRQALQTNETGFVLPYLRRDSGFAQFINKNHFALLMEMAIGLATGFIFGGGVKRNRMLPYVAALTLMWTALVLTSSRGGIFSTLAQVVFLTVILIVKPNQDRRASHAGSTSPGNFRRFVPAAALGAVLLVAVGVSAIWLGGDLLVTRLESMTGEIRAEAGEPHAGVRRREVWSATWQMIKLHPVTGSGFGAYGVAITKFHDASGKWTPEAAHNDYLELLAAGGVVGTSLVIWFAVVFINRARRQLSGAGVIERAACLGALTGIFGVVAHSAVDFGLHVTVNAVVFICLVVFATRNFQGEAN